MGWTPVERKVEVRMKEKVDGVFCQLVLVCAFNLYCVQVLCEIQIRKHRWLTLLSCDTTSSVRSSLSDIYV